MDFFEFAARGMRAQAAIDRLCRTDGPKTSRDAAEKMVYPKLIPLTQGQFAMVDEDKYDELIKYKWYAHKDGNTFYAMRNIGKKPHQKKIYMHREILDTPSDMEVDHCNHNGLDNRCINIKNCTKNENQHNRLPNSIGTSKYKGVCWHKRDKKWESSIKHNNKGIHIGYFDSEIDAAKAYDKTAKKLHGEFAKTNFGD